MSPHKAPHTRHHLRLQSLSLSRRGTWGHIIVAFILITLLPLLIGGWIWKNNLDGTALSSPVLAVSAVIIASLISLGYALLIKYPISITRLRRYLRTLSQGDLPEQVTLTEHEDDIAAVQHYLEQVVRIAEEHIVLLRQKHRVELDEERQRVMVESLGAMCHHIAQPVTVINMCLYRLKTTLAPEEHATVMADCQGACDDMATLINRLRSIALYETESYLHSKSAPDSASESPSSRIIKV
jgi:signal transduction histidine kinase